MRGLAGVVGIYSLFLVCGFANAAAPEDHSSIVVVFKDGHRQSLANAEIARIDLKSPAIVYRDGHREKVSEIDHIEFGESGLSANLPGRNHFIGKWRV